MKEFVVNAVTGQSKILVGERLEHLVDHLPAGRTVIVTDTQVGRIYGDAFPAADVITMGTGEANKTLATVGEIFEKLVALEADRSVFLVGIGGGIVCDVTGFVASTYLRGVRFGFVATTLLAQVDAGVGGKNGVNFGGYKNMVGVFNQPEFVICDPRLLDSLPPAEKRSGLAEIVKHAAIGDASLFSYLEGSADDVLSFSRAAVERMVYDSVALKAGVVSRDEKESGLRRILNFGHTLGHAIEKAAGVSHGEAIGAGMAFAARLSVHRGHLAETDADRLTSLLERFHLPTRIAADPAAVLDALRRDKKRRDETVHFVLLDRIGHAVIDPIPIEAIASMLTGP